MAISEWPFLIFANTSTYVVRSHCVVTLFCPYAGVLIGVLYANNMRKFDVRRIRRLVVHPLSRDNISFGERKRETAVKSSDITRSCYGVRLT